LFNNFIESNSIADVGFGTFIAAISGMTSIEVLAINISKFSNKL